MKTPKDIIDNKIDNLANTLIDTLEQSTDLSFSFIVPQDISPEQNSFLVKVSQNFSERKIANIKNESEKNKRIKYAQINDYSSLHDYIYDRINPYRDILTKITNNSQGNLNNLERAKLGGLISELQHIKSNIMPHSYLSSKEKKLTDEIYNLISNIEEAFLVDNSKTYNNTSNTTSPQKENQTVISAIDLINLAVSSNDDFEISKDQMQNLIKDYIGENLYNHITTLYKIKEPYSLDDVRALMIGVVTNLTDDNLEILKDKMQKDFGVEIEQIYKDLQFTQTSLERLNNASTKGKARQSYAMIKFLLPGLIKNLIKSIFIGEKHYSKNFSTDLNTAITLNQTSNYLRNLPANPSKAEQNKFTLEQRYASGEYLAHKLPYKDLNPGSLIPVPETDGRIGMYQAHQIINEKGLVIQLLTPYDITDSQNPLDIKILCRGTSSLSSAVIDLEKYGAGHQSFHSKELYLAENIDKILGELQTQYPDRQISATVSGHSLGGSIAQNMAALLLRSKSLAKFNDQMPVESFSQMVNAQNMYTMDATERTTAAQATIDRLEKDKLNIGQFTNLQKLSGIHLVTANSAGIANKTNQVASTNAAYLNDTPDQYSVNLSADNIRVENDLIQLSGQDHLWKNSDAKHVKNSAIVIEHPDPNNMNPSRYYTTAHCANHFDSPNKNVKFIAYNNKNTSNKENLQQILGEKTSIAQVNAFQKAKKMLNKTPAFFGFHNKEKPQIIQSEVKTKPKHPNL